MSKYIGMIGRLVRFGLGQAGQTTSIEVVGFLRSTWDHGYPSTPHAFEIEVAGLDDNLLVRVQDNDDWHINTMDDEPIPSGFEHIVKNARELLDNPDYTRGENPEYEKALIELIAASVPLPHIPNDDVKSVIESWLGIRNG